ncbi:putative death-receptor fusion protein-domain-containing protein [Dissophora ornata]|nr:putative death-receptor fusion protein-domain-containing protein [Dissophora ornata]
MIDFFAVGGQPRVEIDMAWHQRALCLYTTLDYAMGRAALHADMDTILDQLSQLLQARVLATNVEVARDHVPSEYTEAMLDLEFVLKLILAMISRLIVSNNESSPSQTPSSTNQFEISPSHKPQEYIVRILKDAITVSSSPVYHRDISSISGMIFANLIDLTSPSVQEATRRIMGLVFGENGQDSSYLPAIPSAMIEMDFGWNTYLGEKCGPGEEDAGMYMLGIVRGLLTNIRQEALVMPIESLSRWYAPAVFHDLPKDGLVLHQVLFHAIAYLCATSKDMSSKTFAFETMGHWLQQTKLHLGERSTASVDMKEALAQCINDQAQEKLTTYVLDYWEDPVDTVQHKVKNILELLLDIVYLKSTLRNEKTTPTFVTQLLERILMADGHRKSKHPILAILVGRVPIAEVVQLRQDALAQAILALEQLATAPGAAVAINAMIEKSWKECVEQDSRGAKVLIVTTTKKSGKESSADTVVSTIDADATRLARKEAMQPWVDFWLKPITQALTADNDLIRKHIGHFIFSPLFSTCPEAFWTLLDVLNDQGAVYSGYISDEKYRFNAIVLAIKVARSLDLVDASNYADLSSGVSDARGPNMRQIDISVLHSAMYHASGDIRIDVLGILCESRRSTTPVASIEYELLMQFLPLNLNSVVPDFRQKLYSHLAKFLARVRGNCYVLAREIAKLHTPVGKKNLTEADVAVMTSEREAKVAETKAFLEWLLDHIFSSIYPGASFQRVSTSLRLLGVMIKTFGIESTPLPPGSKPGDISRFPFQLPIANEEHTKVLLSCLLNPFDHCREQALEILMEFKAPFAGYGSKESVDGMVRWGLDWLKSTRAGESDSGGLVMKTVFVKYAIELGWDIQLPYDESGDLSGVKFAKETGNPAVDFTIRLQNLLRVQLEKARVNQLDAAHHHPLHGSLIGLRYLFSSIDYASPLVTNHRPLWQAVHKDMMDLVENICGIVMGVLSNPSPEGNIPATFTEMEESIDAVISSSGGDEFEQSGGPNHQVILSYCWRAIKESSALMELVLSKATLGSSILKVDGILEPSALDRAGGLFRRLLTTIRHPGAFSSVFPAYISLCTRLLNSEDATLAALPRAWLEENLDSILSDSISVTRRSAGLPLCILAIVNAELSDSRRTLLPMVMRRVMAIAAKPVSPDANQQVDLPQIHAMNVLRRLFMDAKLSTSVLPYVGQGLELSIRAFSSPSWAVRNCGVMLFSTLLHRVFGAKRVRDEHLAINGITSRELFARLEGLCGFLQGQLEVAVSQLLGAESSQDRVHPGLYPVLTLLSRLQPSLHADPADTVDGGMSAFVTLVRRCAASAIWKTREMAARALIPLIASRDLMGLVLDILQGSLKTNISQNETHGLLVQVQFLLRGHLLGEGVADRKVRQSFVTQFADAFGPVTERVLKTGCQMNRWMVLSIYTEFVLGQEWLGRDTVDEEEGAAMEMESEREEMKRLSDVHFKSIRDFIVDYAVVGLVEEKQTYRQQIGGHLVRRLMARTMISATILGVNSALSKEQASDMVRSLLEDDDYEVRLETLETLQQLLESNTDDVKTHLNVVAIHNTLINTLFKGEENLECLRVEVAMITSLGGGNPFPEGSQVKIVEFWERLFMRIDNEATGGVAVVEAILPATGNVFVQIWNDPKVEERLRIDCLNKWACSIHKFANEYQVIPLDAMNISS